MRKIKFKFWDAEKKYMYHSTFNLIEISMMINLKSCHIPLQFIGLHDKNGKEVYEGDLLSDGEDFPMILPVIYDEEYSMFCVDVSFDKDGGSIDEIKETFSDGFTVVGNIYENPELLQ